MVSVVVKDILDKFLLRIAAGILYVPVVMKRMTGGPLVLKAAWRADSHRL